MKGKVKRNKHLTKDLRKGKINLPDGYTIPESSHKHKTSFKSVRKEDYRGRAIRIETTYKVIIDGEPLSSHTQVLDDGTVHCHDFPNYSFTSALDMVRKMIDAEVGFNRPHDEISGEHLTDHQATGDHQNDNDHGGHH